MSHIRSRKHAPSLRPFATATLVTSLALALPAFAAEPVTGADANGSQRDRKDATTLKEIQVTGSRVKDYSAKEVSSDKFTQPIMDTPQTLQVITNDLFTEQGATTLTEALRNTPGVGAFYAGENGSTSTGDTIYMRGFDTSSSIFVDGIRDLGSISRDLFNIEQVEVEKGPAGTDNGRSAPTGAINMVSKQAFLRNAISGTVSGGNDGQKRGNADWNQTFSGLPGSALRLNVMWQDSDVAGRDEVKNKRWGIAPSLGFGLDGPTRVYLNLLYVKQNNIPDGGVPTVGLPGWEPQTGLESLSGHPVNSENFYGTSSDYDDVTAEMATLRFEHDFSDTLKLTNSTRWGANKQDYLLTSYMGSSSNITYTDASDLSTYSIARSLPTYKDQENKILTDQLNLRADFATGSIKHSLSTGVELTREEQQTWGIATTNSSSWPAANLYNPDSNVSGLTWAHNGSGSYGKTDTASAYAFDTIKFGDYFLITGGVRLDHYKTEYDSSTVCGGSGRNAVSCGDLATGTPVTTVDTSTTGNLFNWKLGAVYKVADTVSLYANYALSQQPPGGSNFQLSDSASSASNPKYDPQKARTFEVGTKWNLLDNRLALDVALFQTKVNNEINEDETTGEYYQTGKKSVEGIELSTVGNITDNWSISAGYTRMNTQVDEGSTVTADGTSNLAYSPDDAFTSWTSYRFPFGLTIGGGIRYSGEMHRGTDSAVGTPAYTKSYTVYDAVVSYDISRNISLRLNGYNLFDKKYVAAINKSGYRYTPGTPRTFLLSADLRF